MTYEPMDERGVYVSDASTLLGRGSADGAGPAIPIALGTNLSMSGRTVNVTGGSGDVVGPASAVDGNLAVFDGTTGKLIKDGGAPGGGVNGGVFVFMFITAAGFSPADATTYHFGFRPGFNPGTVADVLPVIAPKGGTIKAVYGNIPVTSVLSSAGNATFTLVNLTAVTSELISNTVTFSANPSTFSNTGMTLAFSAGDRLEITILTPTWATNPTGVYMQVYVYVEFS